MRLDVSLLHSKSRKPQLDSRTFRAHTLDNLLVRRMCDGVLLLERPSFLPQHLAEIQRLSNGSGLYLPTLRANSGTTINRLNFIDNPSVTIGGPCALTPKRAVVKCLFCDCNSALVMFCRCVLQATSCSLKCWEGCRHLCL
jgi:hypothetical protein